jgi:hypothetical protein
MNGPDPESQDGVEMDLSSSRLSHADLPGMAPATVNQHYLFSTVILTPYFLFLISYSLLLIRNLLKFRSKIPHQGSRSASSVRPSSRVKIALSLYKVQQNIYLLDFQRIEVTS